MNLYLIIISISKQTEQGRALYTEAEPTPSERENSAVLSACTCTCTELVRSELNLVRSSLKYRLHRERERERVE